MVTTVVGRALKVLGFVKLNKVFFTFLKCLCILYFSLVRSIFKYGVVVWSPYLAKDQLRLEHVQHRFLFYATYILKIDHPPHDYFLILNTLKIPLLSSRRLDADLAFIAHLLNGSFDVPDLLATISFRIPSYGTGSHRLFHVSTH
ncbi:Hypothetical protein CINCED_3A025380 [Cinara cedri]|uniref:Uncharacterized protein n=1 Tax=Cinara cedri TaxID=506608 RepID=A0A5E4M8X5_9HEMI|nr:Hypothetical protein CINCED_3A025380 [Cinara cedri]